MRFRRSLILALLPIAALVAGTGCVSESAPSEPRAKALTASESTSYSTMESGSFETWPFTVCHDCTAASMLFDIQDAADAALLASSISPAQYGVITTRVTQCLANFLPTGLTYPQHCAKTYSARAAALGGDWDACANQLDHGH